MAKISELKAGQGKVEVEVVVKSKTEPRTFNKYGKELKVATAVVSDDSGEISLSLWNADIDKVNIGDTVKITNGYVSEFNGQKQLTSGKFGTLEVVGSANSSAAAPSVAEAETQNEQSNKKRKPAVSTENIAEKEF